MGGDSDMTRLVTSWIALIFIGVVGFGLLAHAEINHRRERVVRVFDLAKEYRTSMRETSLNFTQRWNQYYDDSVDPYHGGNLDERAYRDLVNRFLQADANRTNYEALSGFYESVGECVREGLCDFWYARATFGNDVTAFYHNMYPALIAECPQGRGCEGIYEFVNRVRDADRGLVHQSWGERAVAWAG